jgi:hypothetical protein
MQMQKPPEQTTDSLPDKCPECGEPTVLGFGLTGGGYGVYVYCDCGFFAKVQEPDDA